MPEENTTYPSPARILIVDDDRHVRQSLHEILAHAGHEILHATDGKSALIVLEKETVDLLLLDLELPRIGGMEVLKKTAHAHPGLPVVIVSGTGTISIAVEAGQLGVYDFLEKPVDAQRMLLTVRNALEKSYLQRERDYLLKEVRERYQMVGSSPAMQHIYRLIDKASSTQSKVLITGASGTGKERIAHAIHINSKRAAGPFVAVNCAAIPEELIESELFGYEKGAFTGAQGLRKGKFEQAKNGTLFLDEVGDMSLMTQAKVLRVLEDGTFSRLGGNSPLLANARIIAATNKDLEREVNEGHFREDLYYRLNIITINAPSLNERMEDIPELVIHFLKLLHQQNELPLKKFEPGAMAALMDVPWPGNIRQLRNVIERLVVLSEKEHITPHEVKEAVRKVETNPLQPPPNLEAFRAKLEHDFILKTLISHDWKIKESSDALGINRSHLWKKMSRYQIKKPDGAAG